MRNFVAFCLQMATDYRNTTGLGLFDRPADDKALRSLLNPPAIPGLTESLTALNPAEWRTLLFPIKEGQSAEDQLECPKSKRADEIIELRHRIM